jgi:hypothetical protein
MDDPCINRDIYCLSCYYNLRGLTERRCPECGRPFDPDVASTYSITPSAQRARKALNQVSATLARMTDGLALLVGDGDAAAQRPSPLASLEVAMERLAHARQMLETAVVNLRAAIVDAELAIGQSRAAPFSQQSEFMKLLVERMVEKGALSQEELEAMWSEVSAYPLIVNDVDRGDETSDPSAAELADLGRAVEDFRTRPPTHPSGDASAQR